MAQVMRLKKTRATHASEFSDKYDVFDAGGYKSLEFMVGQTGTATGNINIEHSSVNEEGTFLPLSPVVQHDLALGTGYYRYNASDFLRFVRWKVDSDIGGNTPVVWIDVIAKES